MAWLQQHSLESYSVGLEFLSQRRGLSPEVKASCEDLLGQRRPIWLNQKFGALVLADILGEAAEPSKIEVFNVRTGFYDPERDSTRKYHTGYYPQNLELFCEQSGFEPWLEDALDRIFCQSEATRLQAAGPGQAAEPGTIHCLLWCNKGTHRSVSACRVLSYVAGELRLNSRLSCISFFFFFMVACSRRCHSHHLSSHQWVLRNKCSMCVECTEPALATATWPAKARRVLARWRKQKFPR